MAKQYRTDSNGYDADVTDETMCENCGLCIDTSDWYPVVTEVESETVVLYTFCDDRCLGTWRQTS